MENNKEIAAKNANQKVKNNKNKKPNIFVRMWKKIREVVSELKKVTWPSFPTVMKQLGYVVAFVLVIFVVVMVFDLGLQQLLKLLQGSGSSAATFLSEVL
ncbi:MAG: preprotein translocase subunit SecE [Candidatus Borkfalkiaceae bacterium]|nr:preprotein translocase subunit SecE [Christensenellaceae bacterium]